MASRRSISAAILLTLPLAGCTSGVLDPRGPVGAAEKLILFNSLAIMLAIVIPVVIATFAFAYHFRASNTKAFYWPEWEFSGRLELIVWAIPTLVITFLGGIAWFGSQELDPFRPLPAKDKPLEVQVVSLDWKWLFIYPEQNVAAVNQLTIPAGRPVHFTLTSATVWNAFFVPQLGSMIYTMAGMTTQLHLKADDAGVYRGRSAMFSGDKFADMFFDVKAVKDDDFSKWIDGAKASGAALDKAAYTKLAQTSGTASLGTFKSVEPDLFKSIVNQTAPPPAGPPNKTNP